MRKRRERALKSRLKKAKATRTQHRERSAADADKAEKSAQSPATTADGEQETHYVDELGRKRKRKTVRTRALFTGEMGGKQRAWTDTERELVVTLNVKMGKPGYGRVATELHRLSH